MTLGTGIFLSALLLGTLFLYTKTQDKWKWKRLIVRGLFGLVGLVAIIVLILYGYSKVSERARPQKEYSGLALGAAKSDVIFLNGKPKHSLPGEKDCFCDTLYFYLKKESYSDNVVYLTVRLKGDSVVGVISRWRGAPYVEGIQGINKYSDMKDVREKFGNPDTVKESTDKTERRWYYKKYNVRFGFEKGQVTSIGIFDPRY